jgi:hypothetical protein
MASVSSLDHDMRKLRLDRYTPQAANEVRGWIEEVLGERIAGGDLMDALKDGVALCKYVLQSLQVNGADSLEPDLSILQSLLVSSTSDPQCLLSKWRIYPTSYRLAKCLRSISLPTIAFSQSTYTTRKIRRKFYNALLLSAEEQMLRIHRISHELLAGKARGQL